MAKWVDKILVQSHKKNKKDLSDSFYRTHSLRILMDKEKLYSILLYNFKPKYNYKFQFLKTII